MAMGINVERYFALAWAMAGIVSALGGVVWGSMLGVDVQLALVGLKVFPVVILGGLDSIVGAVVGGLIIGIVESLAAGYLDPYVGGGTKDFAPYVLMILVLMFRPYGISARQDRAGVEAPCCIASPESSRPPTPPTWRSIRCRSRAGRWPRIAVLFVVIVPLSLHEYYLSILNLILIAIVGALGLNILVGYTGQISVGHGAFMSVGAYTAANLAVKLDLPFWVTLPAGGLMAALIGAIVGIPSLRIKGLYLAIATLAGQLIIEWTINHAPAISGGAQASIEVPRPTLFGLSAQDPGPALFLPAVLRRAGHRGDAEPGPQPHRPRLRRHPRPGHRRRDHRHQHLPLQAAGVRDLVVLRRRVRRALHLLLRHRQLRAVPDRRVDRLPRHDHHRRAGLGAGLDPRRRFSSPCCRS